MFCRKANALRRNVAETRVVIEKQARNRERAKVPGRENLIEKMVRDHATAMELHNGASKAHWSDDLALGQPCRGAA